MHAYILEFGDRYWVPMFDEPYRAVGAFLCHEVGPLHDKTLKEAEDVATGKIEPEEYQGNHTIIRIMPTWVLIGSHLEPSMSPQIISMDAYLSVLRYWKSIMDSKPKSGPPVNAPEFNYEDPTVPGMTSEKAAEMFNMIIEEWKDIPVYHHRSELETGIMLSERLEDRDLKIETEPDEE